MGVDLNRNYGYMFGATDIGSSPNPCAEDYRGPYAFSEPETKAMKKFVEQANVDHQLKVAFNFHAYGNLFIFPFNSDSASNPTLYQKFPEYARIYEELASEIGLPAGNIKGNAKASIYYDTNGEASDWMLGS